MSTQPKAHGVREAIKQAIKWHRIAIDTGNTELQQNARDFVRRHYHSRHSKSIVIFNA